MHPRSVPRDAGTEPLAYGEGMSARAAAKHFNISRGTVEKMLALSVPPGYRREKTIKCPKLDGFTEIIDAWLEADKAVHRKQHHTARRIWERLQAEHGFTGGYTTIKDFVRAPLNRPRLGAARSDTWRSARAPEPIRCAAHRKTGRRLSSLDWSPLDGRHLHQGGVRMSGYPFQGLAACSKSSADGHSTLCQMMLPSGRKRWVRTVSCRRMSLCAFRMWLARIVRAASASPPRNAATRRN